MSQGNERGVETYIKAQKDIKYGLSQRREMNLAKRIAKEAEETDKNIIWRDK